MRLALQGGPVIAEQMLTADTKFSDEMKLQILKTEVGIKANRALDIAFSTPKSAVQVFKIYSEMLLEEQAEAVVRADRGERARMVKLDVEQRESP